MGKTTKEKVLVEEVRVDKTNMAKRLFTVRTNREKMGLRAVEKEEMTAPEDLVEKMHC